MVLLPVGPLDQVAVGADVGLPHHASALLPLPGHLPAPWKKKGGRVAVVYPSTVPARVTRYSVVPAPRSRDIVALEPAKLPWASAWTMNCPAGVVAPCPVRVVAAGSVCADPDEMVYVVPSTTTLPWVIESVYPDASLPVTVKVTLPDAVPVSLASPTTKYLPCVLVTVIVCPTVRLACCCCGARPGPPRP